MGTYINMLAKSCQSHNGDVKERKARNVML